MKKNKNIKQRHFIQLVLLIAIIVVVKAVGEPTEGVTRAQS